MTTTINNQALAVIEYQSQRVITLSDVDRLHQRTDGTARRNFNANKQHFTEGDEYFEVSANEIRTHKIADVKAKFHGTIIFLTKTGYLLLVKSLTDNLAWKIQKELIKSYFESQQNHSKLTTGNPLLDESYYHLQESTKFNTDCLHEHEYRIIDVENQVKDHTEQIEECKQDIDTLKQVSSSSSNYRQFTKDCMAAFSMDTYEFRRWARKAVIAISSKENIHTNSVYSDLYNEMDEDGRITAFRNDIKRDADWLYRLVKVNGKWQRREKRVHNVFDAITMYHVVLPHVPRTYRDSFTKLILDRLEA